jgi:hypothetical protein
VTFPLRVAVPSEPMRDRLPRWCCFCGRPNGLSLYPVKKAAPAGHRRVKVVCAQCLMIADLVYAIPKEDPVAAG